MKKILFSLIAIFVLSLVPALVLFGCKKKSGSNNETEGLYAVRFIVDGVEQSISYVEPGQRVKRPTDPKKIGYNFDYWYTTPDGDQTYNFGNKIYSNFTLYARFYDNKLTLYVSGDHAVVSDCDPGATSVTFPEIYRGKPVTELSGSVFSGCTELTEISIPSRITKFGNGYLFYGCSSLKSIEFYSMLGKKFRDFFFLDPEASIENITINSGELPFEAFNYCMNIKNVTLGSGVTVIGEKAFYNCTSLTNITIANGVTEIKENAFWGCTSLENIMIPNSVTTIGSGAFAGCSSLTSVALPNTVKTLGDYVFPNELGRLNYLGTISDWCNLDANILAVIQNVYVDGTNIKEITTITGQDLATATKIGQYAFYGCSNLVNITIPNNITSIGENAFYGCTGLTEISIPSSVTSIGDCFIEYCNSLLRIDYAGTIGRWISVSSDVVVPGREIYINNINIKNISTITEQDMQGATKIGSNALYGCNNLTSITIPSSVTSIGYNAFYGCSGLTSIEVPESVTNIGAGAFAGCGNLVEMVLPFAGGNEYSSSGRLFGYIFGGEEYEGGVAITQEHTKNYAYGKVTYYIPASIRSVTILGNSISYGAFYNCNMLTSVVIGRNVTAIYENAFYCCTNLTTVTIQNRDRYKAAKGTGGGGLLNNVQVVKVLKTIDDASNTYLNGSTFSKDTISDPNYNIYTKNN